MLIIDHLAEVPLANTLRKLKSPAEQARCIYFKLKDRAASLAHPEPLILITEQLEHSIPSSDMQLYQCQDGDIFIIAPYIPSKPARDCILDITHRLRIPATEEWVRFVELPQHAHALLEVVEVKLAQLQQQQEVQKQQEEIRLTERKRQAILSGADDVAQETIKHRREERKTPAVMIIEDDHFTRRLVENVLQKDYPITGLGEVTHALDTYARIAPNLLFLDIDLPDVTGHELLEKIMTLDPDAYVVMLSGNADRDNIMQAMRRGAKGFVAKPFTKDKLLQYIERCPTLHCEVS